MTTREMDFIAPLATPLPPPPTGEVFTNEQWTTILAVADTVVPSIRPSAQANKDSCLAVSGSEYSAASLGIQAGLPAGIDPALADQYLGENASQIPGFKESLHRTFTHYVRGDARKGIALILNALNTRPGSLLLTGNVTLFHQQPIATRQAILRSWSTSYLPPLRQSYKAFTSLFKQVWLKTSPTIGPVLGFPKAPVHGKPGNGYSYDFLQFAAPTAPDVVDTDVVIIGSGCGGAVCAKNLAEDGHRVIVVDKGYYHPPENLPMSEEEGQIHLFMNGGIEISDDGSTSIIAGQVWGGGGTVNWSASLQTQGFVRREWASKGLPFFTSSEYQKCLDRVCHRMGVDTRHIEHNPANRALLEGSRRMGFSAKAVPQNTGGNRHYCGYCTLGCGSAEKQGPVVSWLPDAARAGAQFIEGFDVDRVLFNERQGQKVAVGLKGFWTSRDTSGGLSGSDRTRKEIVIRAKKVIVSAGSLQSPLVLIRSGLTNPQIGRNLHLHPVTIVAAIYKEETRPWEGGILTSLCDEYQNIDGHGHGVKLETAVMLPSYCLSFLPWTGGLDFKLLCSKLNHMAAMISLGRDRDTGRVYPDPVDGRPRIQYSPSAFDRTSILEGVIALAKISLVAGAQEILTATQGIPSFTRSEVPDGQDDPGVNDPRFQQWLTEIRKKGINSPDTPFATAHQMGTCRMGIDPNTSVVDPRGKVWKTEGLYVSDASVFPSASGVNPMVTNMAISDWISNGIAKELRAEARVFESARL